MLQHLLGYREIRDYAVFQGPNGRDIARCPAKHVFGFRAHCLDCSTTATGIFTNRHNRWFVQHNAVTSGIDERVGGPEIDRQIVREVTEKVLKHVGEGPRM